VLTATAERYLGSLTRLPALPAKLVEASVVAQGARCFDAWLAFHETYAGFVEPLGSGDFAVWGIVHERPNWLGARQAELDGEVGQATFYVTCADVHPSYVYRLDQDGEFFTPPAQAFETRVERRALLWDFAQGGRLRPMPAMERNRPEVLAGLREAIAAGGELCLVPQASDRYFRYFRDATRVVVEDARRGRILQVWRRS